MRTVPIASPRHTIERGTGLRRSTRTSRSCRRPKRRRGREAAAAELDRSLEGLSGKVAEIHAGARYRDAIEPGIKARNGRLVNPLAGLSIGRQLQWYGR